jgi:hypothetical protein
VFRPLLITISAIILCGCPAAPLIDRALSTEEKRKERVENYWNSWVGKYLPVEKYFGRVILDKTVAGDTTTFLLTQHHNACRIFLVTSNKDSVVKSWGYGSEPAECWKYVSPAP